MTRIIIDYHHEDHGNIVWTKRRKLNEKCEKCIDSCTHSVEKGYIIIRGNDNEVLMKIAIPHDAKNVVYHFEDNNKNDFDLTYIDN